MFLIVVFQCFYFKCVIIEPYGAICAKSSINANLGITFRKPMLLSYVHCLNVPEMI